MNWKTVRNLACGRGEGRGEHTSCFIIRRAIVNWVASLIYAVEVMIVWVEYAVEFMIIRNAGDEECE